MRCAFLVVAFFACVGLVGCGDGSPYSSSAYPVSGKVVGPYGEAIRGAEVVLSPKARDGKVYGMEGSGVVNNDGTFTIKTADGREGLPGGYYLVVVRPYGAQKSTDKQFASAHVPKKLWSEDTSDMTVEITGEKTNWELKLTR
jgi:hypothetical protein